MAWHVGTVMGLGRPVHEPYKALHLNLDHATPLVTAFVTNIYAIGSHTGKAQFET
jgi:hypothetical protein